MQTFEDLCEKNYERIYKYIWGMLDCPTHAEDLVQEVFIIAWRRKKHVLKHSCPEAFLYKTAKNLVFQHIRREKRERRTLLTESVLPPDDIDILEGILKDRDRRICEDDYLEKVLSQLSEEKRMLYEDYYIEHKSMKAIAAERSMNHAALRMKYVRLRKELKTIVMGLKLNEP